MRSFIRTIRRILNRPLHNMAMFLPGSESVRPFLHRLRGVKITGRVFIGDQAYLENEYPEAIELHDGSSIGIRSTLIAHFRGPGKIIVEKGVWIGPHCVITSHPGYTLRIGENAMISAGSVITSSVPANTMVGIEKAKPLAMTTRSMNDIDDYYDFLGSLKPLPKPGKKD